MFFIIFNQFKFYKMLEWFKTPSGSYSITLILSIVAWLLAGIGIIAGFNHYKVKTRDATENAAIADSLRVEMEKELNETKLKLDSTKIKSEKISIDLESIKTPRFVTERQKQDLLQLLKKTRKGTVVVTYLSVERDAENYAKQIVEILKQSGYNTILSKHLWLQLAHDGIFICAWEPHTVPFFATDLQNSMKSVGIKIAGSYDSDFLSTLKVPCDGIALVISNKKLN
jgi:hypothetical protein